MKTTHFAENLTYYVTALLFKRHDWDMTPVSARSPMDAAEQVEAHPMTIIRVERGDGSAPRFYTWDSDLDKMVVCPPPKEG